MGITKEILARLRRRPRTEPEIRVAVGLSAPGLRPYLVDLRRGGRIHIVAWSRKEVAGLKPYLRPVYAAGPGEDAPRPPPLTQREIQREFARRVAADPEKYRSADRTRRAVAALQSIKAKQRRVRRLSQAGYVVGGLSQGRVMYGSKRCSPTPGQVAEILRLRELGRTWKQISAKTGVPESTARAYFRRLTG